MLTSLLTILYIFCALLLAVYAASEMVLLLLYWMTCRRQMSTPAVNDWPAVTIQLPLYNERHVITRLLEAVVAMDYPADRLLVQVLDDSTDETAEIAVQLVESLAQRGSSIRLIHRTERSGYKAGALAHGLSQTQTPFVVVLDADFVPPPDFLRRTIPHLLADPGLGMVQTRWGHLNPFTNLLTRGQTLALDAHFVVEQTARSRAGLLMSFNGSGGVWRVMCIQEAGGWRDTTLTEDLDLSYRAQLAGWRLLYLPDVVVPGELPPQMAAYKQQQARWATGSTQVLWTLFTALWRSRFSFVQRLMATLHLCQYLPHPLMLLLLLLTPPLLLTHSLEYVSLGWMGLVGLGPPIIYVVSQQALYPDWKRRILAFPILLALGTGIAWNNTAAVFQSLRRRQVFKRTPKFGKAWGSSSYTLHADPHIWVELALAGYALWAASLAWHSNRALLPFLLIYVYAFGTVALWGLHERWSVRKI